MINRTLILFTTIMGLLSFLSFLGCNGNIGSSTETLTYPPFRIQKRNVVDRRFKPNEGTVSKSTYAKYKIFYQDQPVTFPPELDANTGVSGIWKTYYLQDAPTPTLLIGSGNVYLVNEENEAPKLTLIEKKYSNYASVQWLDSAGGQPGKKTQILIGEDTTDCILAGGEFLLVNDNTVLRVKDLAIFPFEKSTGYTDNYYTNQVLAFSPDKNELVYLGSKNHPEIRTEFIHALLIYNFKDNSAYAIPFDRTETRLHEPYEVGPDWVYTYFEWQENEDGKYILTKKNLDPLPNWEGHITRSSNYALTPVKGEMHEIFFKFVKGFWQLNDSDIRLREYGGIKEYTINHKEFVFDVGYLKELNHVSLSLSFMNKGPENEAHVIIKEVGDAFNEVLKQGEHQTLFTNYLK